MRVKIGAGKTPGIYHPVVGVLILPGDCSVGHDAEKEEDTEEVGQTVSVNIIATV